MTLGPIGLVLPDSVTPDRADVPHWQNVSAREYNAYEILGRKGPQAKSAQLMASGDAVAFTIDTANSFITGTAQEANLAQQVTRTLVRFTEGAQQAARNKTNIDTARYTAAAEAGSAVALAAIKKAAFINAGSQEVTDITTTIAARLIAVMKEGSVTPAELQSVISPNGVGKTGGIESATLLTRLAAEAGEINSSQIAAEFTAHIVEKVERNKRRAPSTDSADMGTATIGSVESELASRLGSNQIAVMIRAGYMMDAARAVASAAAEIEPSLKTEARAEKIDSVKQAALDAARGMKSGLETAAAIPLRVIRLATRRSLVTESTTPMTLDAARGTAVETSVGR